MGQDVLILGLVRGDEQVAGRGEETEHLLESEDLALVEAVVLPAAGGDDPGRSRAGVQWRGGGGAAAAG